MKENSFIQMSLATIKDIPPQIDNALQILLVLKGSIQIGVNQKKCRLKKNALILLNCHDVYTIKGDEANIVLILKVPFEYLKKECEDLLPYTFACYSGETDTETNQQYDEIRRIMIYMMLSFSRMEEGYRLHLRSSLFQLLHYLLTHFKASVRQNVIVASEGKDRRINALLAYIQEHYQEDISLSALAQRECVSVPYLSKLFKKQTGIGFLDYLNNKRLESALKDLMSTDEPILKIALKNGFANADALTKLFKKHYDETPNQFKQNRERAPNRQNKAQAHYTLLPIETLGGLPELVNYIQLYHDPEYANNRTNGQSIRIATDRDQGRLIPFKRILRIGKCLEALKGETQKQLRLAQRKLKCHYVYFQGVFADGMFLSDEQSMYRFYEYNQLIEYFESIELIPFIQINVLEIIRQQLSVEEACAIFRLFLSNMSKHFAKAFIDEWQFDIVADEKVTVEDYFAYYQVFYRLLKQFSPDIAVGLFALSHNNETEKQRMRQIVLKSQAAACPPDFMSLTADPEGAIGELAGIRAESYTQLRGYHLAVVRALQMLIAECGLGKTPLYLTQWNTLAGKSFLEAGSFYRSALISEAMLALSGQIEGLSFWLSEYSREQLTQVQNNNVLSLFHCFTAKKSTFFILQAFARLGSNIVFQDEHITVTKNQQGDCVVMVSNPCYFNPLYSMDSDFIRTQQKKWSIELTDLASGRYRIKVFHFKMTFTFAIDNTKVIHEIGSYRYNDEDILDYVENIASPEFSLLEEDIQDSYTLTPDLSSNAVILYFFRKI